MVVPTNRLEHAPETVAQVEPDGHEPEDVDHQDPPSSKRGGQQVIRIGGDAAGEFLQLHLGPEMGQMEEQDTEDNDTQDEHVRRGPGVGLGLAGDFITLVTAAGLDVVPGQVDAITDMHDETQCKDRHHDGHDREGHEIAAFLEETVECAELAGEGIYDGEEVDRTVEEQENDQECSAHRLDELPTDGIMECVCHIV